MIHRQPPTCAACGGEMVVRELECPACDITVRGRFETCPFCTLSQQQLDLIKIFLKSRGNIKEVEREMGISYPTVRARLEEVVRALGFAPVPEVTKDMKAELLAKLEAGEIDADEFLRRLADASA
ncbi:MAG: DUF2089 domain-containing protein [Candidatus Eisenbacteria bacterium]|nr:DUF2089 domain-containing protein [Candidatus Eisenbacteria bacterium]